MYVDPSLQLTHLVISMNESIETLTYSLLAYDDHSMLISSRLLVLVVQVYFLPDFLIPCWPAFRGPFPLAFSAISLLAFASVGDEGG